MLDVDDIIVAVSTPPAPPEAPGLRSAVRLSGPGCWQFAAGVVEAEPATWSQPSGFRAVAGILHLDDRLPLPVTVFLFRGPRSYTGQDIVELHLPGSAALAGQVVELLLRRGARSAEPGEFTLRAVLSGRIDLTQAEAVAALIAARSDGQLRAAMQLAAGSLSRQVAGIVDSLTDLAAEIEAGLDFADEPIQFISAETVAAGLATAGERIARLQAGAASFESLEHRLTVALIGWPNAGKSTLLNRLSGLERALCSPLAGTTRDVLAAPLSLPGGEVLLLDAAGVGMPDDECRMPNTRTIEHLSRSAAERAARSADLLIVVLDATRPLEPQRRAVEQLGLGDRPRIEACNKVDAVCPAICDGQIVPISALTGQGIERLREEIGRRVFSHGESSRPAEGLALNARHHQSLAEAGQALDRARGLVDASPGGQLGPSADLLAAQVREAIEQLGRISGQVMSEDILERIFSRFCVGK